MDDEMERVMEAWRAEYWMDEGSERRTRKWR